MCVCLRACLKINGVFHITENREVKRCVSFSYKGYGRWVICIIDILVVLQRNTGRCVISLIDVLFMYYRNDDLCY